MLCIRVNQPTHAICEQDIDLSGFDDCRYLAFAEVRMHHGLATTISAGAIINRARFG
jgi:hypothetical protein